MLNELGRCGSGPWRGQRDALTWLLGRPRVSSLGPDPAQGATGDAPGLSRLLPVPSTETLQVLLYQILCKT